MHIHHSSFDCIYVYIYTEANAYILNAHVLTDLYTCTQVNTCIIYIYIYIYIYSGTCIMCGRVTQFQSAVPLHNCNQCSMKCIQQIFAPFNHTPTDSI